MGRLKRDLFEFDKKTSELIFDYCSSYEESIVFRFLNYNFDSIEPGEKEQREIIEMFMYDQMLGQNVLVENVVNLDDFHIKWKDQMTYFSFIQKEMKDIFLKIIAKKKGNPSGIIRNGSFQVLEGELKTLGNLKYEILFGNLSLVWDSEVKSFRQLLYRSLVTFFKGDKIVLDQLSICQNSACGKIYFNKKNNPKYCIPMHGKNAGDMKRDQSKRHKKESHNPKYARYRIIEKRYSK